MTPPYCNSTKYATDTFDTVSFWEWVREKSKTNYVLISEYSAPEDFDCIWSKSTTTSLKVDKHEKRTEKLFTYKNGKYSEWIKVKTK